MHFGGSLVQQVQITELKPFIAGFTSRRDMLGLDWRTFRICNIKGLGNVW